MTPAKYGVIKYTALGGEPVRGYPHYPFGANVPMPPAGPTYSAGDTVLLYLDYGYTRLDKSTKDHAHTNLAVGGLAETLFFGSIDTYHLQLSTITDKRALGYTEEIACFEAMAEAGIKGQILTWYPSWTDGTDPYYQCALRKRVSPTRMGGNLQLWTFSIDLEVLPTVTIPASIPVFV